MPLNSYFAEISEDVEKRLDILTPPADLYPPSIHQAMRYSLFAGGKRLRPVLAVTACEMFGASRETALPFGVALEMIHTYTLIHDDLPALDDDDLRRGKPASHIKFGESTAILAGDALLTLSFKLLSDTRLFPEVSAETLLKVSAMTAEAIGSTGTIGGQVVDLDMEGAEPDMAALEYIHTHKTGKLIVAAVKGGALLGGADEPAVKAITTYGRNIGLAFQVTDDILDVEGDAKLLGKNPGADQASGKLTYPALLGMDESKQFAGRLVANAIDSLSSFPDERSKHLKSLAEYIAKRTH